MYEAEITQYIQNVLQREPNPGEVEAWQAVIESNSQTLEEVRDSIINGSEAVNNVYPVILAYQAIYGRVPDAGGLDYWTDVYEANLGLDDPSTPTVNEAMVAVLSAFVDPDKTPEFVTRYGADPTGDQFVAAAYQNVLNRVPDQDGLTYWQGRYAEIEASYANSGMSEHDIDVAVRSQILEQFVNSVEYKTATAEEVDAYLAAHAEGDATSGSLWDYDPDAGQAGVVTLTEGVDTLTANVFNAPRGFTPGGTDQVNTLNDDDVLTGTGDNPTLNLSFVDNADTWDQDIVPTLNGIQTININVRTDRDSELDLQDSTGVQNINVSGIDDGGEFGVDNIQDAAGDGNGINLSVNDSHDDGGEVYFEFQNSAVNGSSDVANLTLNNVDVDYVGINDENYDNGVGIETHNITSTGGSNTVEELEIEDAETLNIDGDSDLTLGSQDEATRGFTDQVEAFRYNPGLDDVAGSLSVINASALTGDLDLTIGEEISADQDGTSGTEVDLQVTGGSGNDTFRLVGLMDSANDSIDGGDGDNTIQIFDSVTDGTISNIQMLDIRGGQDGGDGDDSISVDTSLFTGLETVWIRNEGMSGLNTDNSEGLNVFLNEVSADLAQNIFLQHSTTGSNGLLDNMVDVDLAADTADDSVAVTWVDQLDNEDRGINTDPRFNFELDLDANDAPIGEGVENVTLNDTDSESNTVRLTNFAEHTGTLTLTGGQAGEFLNLDSQSAGFGDVGIYGLDSSGATTGDAAGTRGDVINNLGTADRLVFETINAETFVGDAIVRIGDVDVNATFGAGNDTVIFDQLGDSHAGLSISDSVNGGDGDDTLVIDGNAVNTIVGASEWTNVSGFETIRLVNNNTGGPGNAGAYGTNDYNLLLTNDLIDNNGEAAGTGRLIHIVNDNDLTNDDDAATSAVGAPNSGVTIDARQLDAQHSFSYNGEDGPTWNTDDRFIMSDANINGMAQIDGGAAAGATSSAANGDVLEVRNAAVVTIGDLAGVQNVGTIEFTNDTASVQSSVLELNNEIVDRLVNDFHTATSAEPENLTINVEGNLLVPGAETHLDLDTTGVTSDAFSVTVNLSGDASVDMTGDANVTINGTAGDDTIATGGGDDTVNAGEGNNVVTTNDGDDTVTAGAGNDTIDVGNGDDDVNAGAGNNTVTLGAGADTVHFDAGDSHLALLNSFTIVTDFTSGEDTIDITGTPGDYAEFDASGIVAGDFAALTANATAAFDGGSDIYVAYDAWNSGDAFVFVDDDGDGTYQDTETFVQLVGVDQASEISLADFA